MIFWCSGRKKRSQLANIPSTIESLSKLNTNTRTHAREREHIRLVGSQHSATLKWNTTKNTTKLLISNGILFVLHTITLRTLFSKKNINANKRTFKMHIFIYSKRFNMIRRTSFIQSNTSNIIIKNLHISSANHLQKERKVI